MKIRWTLIAALALMTSCGKEIPGDIIQPDMMEKVLYDYHLSINMSPTNKNTDKEAYKNYIFQKYQITEAEFDSSMVWYTRESKELTNIYDNLSKRFAREYAHVERLLESRNDNNKRISVSGDTVNIWRKEQIHWMASTPLNKQLVFDIEADTTFHERDAFLWQMDYAFLTEGKAIMGMNVIFDNDSVIGTTQVVESSGPQSIYLHTDSLYKVKALNGFIHVPDEANQNPCILVHNISLTRYHQPMLTDSLSTNTQVEEIEVPEDSKPLEKKDVKKARSSRMLQRENR